MHQPITMSAQDIYDCARAGKTFPKHILIDMPDKEGLQIKGVDFGMDTTIEIHNKDFVAIGIAAGRIISHDDTEKDLSAFTIGKSVISHLDIANKSSVNIINMHFLQETRVDGVAAGFQFIGNREARHLYLNDAGVNQTGETSSVRIYQNAHLRRVDIGEKGSLDYDIRNNPYLHTLNIRNLPVTESAFFFNNPALDKTGEALIFGNKEEEDMYCCTTDNEHFVYAMPDPLDFTLLNFAGNRQEISGRIDWLIGEIKQSTRADFEPLDVMLTHAFQVQRENDLARRKLEMQERNSAFLEQSQYLRLQKKLAKLKIQLAQNRLDKICQDGKTRLDNLHKHKHYFKALISHYFA